MTVLDEIAEVIEFALAHKGAGWKASTVETYRYKDTGEILWSINMFNYGRHSTGIGEEDDRLLIKRVDGILQARSVQRNRWDAAHYSKRKGQKHE